MVDRRAPSETQVLEDILAPSPGPEGLLKVVRILVPFLFVGTIISASVVTLPLLGVGASRYSHHYVKVSSSTGLAPVGRPIESVPYGNSILQARVTSLGQLSQMLNPGVLTFAGQVWTLRQPVVIGNGARLLLRGPGSLELARGSFLEVSPGGTIEMSRMHIFGGSSNPRRGFLFDFGGKLGLDHVQIKELGRLATFTSGVTFVDASRGSQIRNSVIVGDTVGVNVEATSRLVLDGNRISASALDGVFLHDRVTRVRVVRNTITSSGLDNIAIESSGSGDNISENHLDGSARYGISLYNVGESIRVVGNSVSHSIDGIVLNSASHATVGLNGVDAQRRFGIRLSGSSRKNLIDRNRLGRCPVGIYLASGATKNRLLDNQFGGNAENVRDRISAPANSIVPKPGRSELGIS